MRHLLLTIVFALMVVFAGQAQAEDWVDKTWCVEVNEVEYCLEFERGPFGPGVVGDVTLKYLPVDAIVGPAETVDAGNFSQPDPEQNGPITLHGLDLKARIQGGTMTLYDDVLKLRAE